MADNIVDTTSNNLTTNDTQPFDTTGDRGERVFKSTSSSLNALGPVVSEPYSPDKHLSEHASNPTTPGDLFPGAFPKVKYVQPSSLNQDADYVKEAASNALETAKEYVYSASEVVGGYLPKSVAAYFPNNESPKQGDESFQRHEDSPQNNSIVSESHSETFPGPGAHGNTLEDGNIPEDVGITGTRVIEDHSFVGQTPTTTKSTTQDVNGTTKPENNTLAPPMFGETGDRNDSNNKSGAVSTSSKHYDGASTDASTRTLAGSRVDTWSHVNTATNSTNESQKADMRNVDGTMKTSSSAADHLQLNFDAVQNKEHSDPDDKADRPDFEHHPEEARHISAPPISKSDDKSAAPHVTSPVTTGREHLSTVEKSTKPRSDSKPFAHQDSLGSTMATPGHEGHGEPSGKGKEKGHFGDIAAANTSGNTTTPSAAQTGAWAGSVVTGIDTSASRPTINNAPADDTGAWAANVVAGLDTPVADRNSNAQHLAAHPTPSTQVITVGTDGNTPIISKALPDTPDRHPEVSSANTKTKSGSPTKPKFMDKLRGEIKILSGKLENSQEKIEEGRRLMGKSSSKN